MPGSLFEIAGQATCFVWGSPGAVRHTEQQTYLRRLMWRGEKPGPILQQRSEAPISRPEKIQATDTSRQD